MSPGHRRRCWNRGKLATGVETAAEADAAAAAAGENGAYGAFLAVIVRRRFLIRRLA